MPTSRGRTGAFSNNALDVTSPTIKGQPVSDEQLQAWSDEAAAGYPVE